MSYNIIPEREGYEKPLPVITPETKPFWDAAKKHELRVQKCQDCSLVFWPPGALCPNCLSDRLEWTRMSGKGKVRTLTIMHRPLYRGFANDVPYNVTEVQLDEGPTIISTTIGIPNDQIKVGMPVEATFDDVTSQISMLKFKPQK